MSIGIKSPGKYVQGKGALNDLGKNVKKLWQSISLKELNAIFLLSKYMNCI